MPSRPDIFLRKPTQHPDQVLKYKTRIKESRPNIEDETAENKARNQVTKALRHMRRKVSNSLFIAERTKAKNATIDPLTGLRSRRFLMGDETKKTNETGELELRFKQALRYGRDLTIMMIDIDDLKKINDTYGHSTGDEFFKIFSQAATHEFREIDILARSGGDEFCFILPEAKVKEVSKIAERFIIRYKKEQEKSQLLLQKGIKPIGSLSIGIINIKDDRGQLIYDPETDGEKYQDFLDKADNALYVAKNLGKDQVVIYGSEKYMKAKHASPIHIK